MHDFGNNHPLISALGFVFYFVCLWCAVGFLLAFLGGWRTLAKRFRCTSPFSGSTWGAQSGFMRWMVGYGRCLAVGADATGLFLRTMLLFQAGHPALFVPWDEVSIQKRWKLLFFRFVEFSL